MSDISKRGDSFIGRPIITKLIFEHTMRDALHWNILCKLCQKCSYENQLFLNSGQKNRKKCNKLHFFSEFSPLWNKLFLCLMYMWVLSKQKKNPASKHQWLVSSIVVVVVVSNENLGGFFNKMFFVFFLNKIRVWYIYNNFTQLLKNKFQVKFSY